MKPKYWRALVEITGVVSIVAGLLLVAWEIRQANEIARAEIVMDLAGQYNEFNSARFENPEVADLSLKLMSPGDFVISEIDRSRMAGAAWHFGNILWSAQIAYDSGLLNLEDLQTYQSHLAWMLVNMPGLTDEFVHMWRSSGGFHDVYVFQPLERYVADLPDTPTVKH